MNENRVIEVTEYEQRVMLGVLSEKRNDFIAESRPTEDVNNLILKVMDAPAKKHRKRDRNER